MNTEKNKTKLKTCNNTVIQKEKNTSPTVKKKKLEKQLFMKACNIFL